MSKVTGGGLKISVIRGQTCKDMRKFGPLVSGVGQNVDTDAKY